MIFLVSCTLPHFHTIQQPQMGEWRGYKYPKASKEPLLTTSEKGSVGWTDAMLYLGVGSSGDLNVTYPSKICWHNCSDAIHRRCVGSSGVEGPLAKTSLSVSSWPSDGPTLALIMASVHPMLEASSWRVSVLIQTERHIDRRCPLSDYRIIRFYCLRCSSSASHPTHLEYRPSDHPTVSTSFGMLRSVPTTPTLCTDGTVGSSDGVFFLPFLHIFNLDLCFNLTYLTCHHL
jgi:hypothetical protein